MYQHIYPINRPGLGSMDWVFLWTQMIVFQFVLQITITSSFCSDATASPKAGSWHQEISCGVIGLDETERTLFGLQLFGQKSSS
jgi:hypothetical protein